MLVLVLYRRYRIFVLNKNDSHIGCSMTYTV
jgi:hypothetical protein